jgi:hypothetical protein
MRDDLVHGLIQKLRDAETRYYDYRTIIAVAQCVPENVLQEDP